MRAAGGIGGHARAGNQCAGNAEFIAENLEGFGIALADKGSLSGEKRGSRVCVAVGICRTGEGRVIVGRMITYIIVYRLDGVVAGRGGSVLGNIIRR